MGMFKGLKHLEFAGGVQTLPFFIPLIPDVLQASPLLEMLLLYPTRSSIRVYRHYFTQFTAVRVTWDAVSKVVHLVSVRILWAAT